jgi:hypothetical protein
MFDYALWHGQGAYIEKLARDAKFGAALPLTHEGELLGRSERTLYGWRFVNPSKDEGFADDPKNPMGRATRAVAAMRERLLRPYLERSPKTILQDCGLYGVDHRTYCGATPLMLAARAGNLALVEQLLERGADADLVDDYGHTAWMGALNRAIDDHAFGKAHLCALFERLGPDTLDVHADGRLVRLERGQGEFWLLGLMLAGLKTHAGGLFARPLGPQRHMRGFFSDSLLRTLELLPEHLWPKSRRKRDYVSGVMARAEVGSAYRPARKLWKRRETGYYAPAPDLKLRRKTADGETWTSIADAMNLAAVADGAGGWFFDVYSIEAVAATGSQAEANGSAWF